MLLRILRALPALLLLAQAASAADYQIAPAPAWVQTVPLPAPGKAPDGIKNGIWPLLTDTQVRIDDKDRTLYQHTAQRAQDSRGVNGIADLSLNFDPSYETLTVHSLRVVRAGQVIDKLGSARFQVLQREKNLEYQIYDGSKTLNVVVDDLRVGDVLEYAYSRRGINPVFHGMSVGGADLQWAVPVSQVLVRVLAPAARPIQVFAVHSKRQPQVSEAEGWRESRWEQRDVPALVLDDEAPAEYDPYAFLLWTEYPNWKAVVDWALPLYRNGPLTDPALRAVVTRITATAHTPQEQARAVLQLVQAEVRYLGVEVGPGSHAPRPPADTWRRRFGDCKDKARLTVTLLQALGIEAAPALVNTERRTNLSERLPSPSAFNHVVVWMRIGGQVYWVDPTRDPQAGDLAHLSQAHYGQALVLAPGVDALRTMLSLEQRLERKTVHAIYDARGDYDKPMRYTIETVLEGAAADKLRAQLAARGKAEVETNYLNYYARNYPDIRLAEPMRVEDDETNNRLTTHEAYDIKGFWTHVGKAKQYNGEVFTAEIRSRLRQPDTLIRTTPVGRTFPEEIDEITEVRLPGPWKNTPKAVKVSDAAFEFRHTTEAGSGDVKYRMHDHYRALAAAVAPADVRSFADRLQEANEALGLTLNRDPDKPATPPEPQRGAHLLWLSVILPAWFAITAACVASTGPNRRFHWSLWRPVTGAAVCIWAAFAGLDNGWKPQSLTLLIAFIASSILLKAALRAPSTHWLAAITVREQRDALPRQQRYAARVLTALPNFILGVALYYYVSHLVR